MGDRLVSKLDEMVEPEAASVHRLGVISGTGRRRSFSEDFKARVVEETLAPGAVVSQIARRRGLTPQQVFTWRRQAREASSGESAAEVPMFVPAVVDAARSAAPAMAGGKPERKRRRDNAGGVIEIEIAGTVIRVGRGADAETVAAVIAALKATT
jgi:transposase